MICEDKKVADQVATYSMTSEELALYHQEQNQKMKKGEKKFEKDTDTTEDDETKSNENDAHGSSQEDNELLESDYILLPEPVNLMQVTNISIRDNTEI
mmetsp:Transcript_10606/g.9172  ORF Transcript_10606/g.9172 Transcript_10606/m.9172 type:complete len:98 (+) Transcript_10606:1582-1875(+)